MKTRVCIAWNGNPLMIAFVEPTIIKIVFIQPILGNTLKLVTYGEYQEWESTIHTAGVDIF